MPGSVRAANRLGIAVPTAMAECAEQLDVMSPSRSRRRGQTVGSPLVRLLAPSAMTRETEGHLVSENSRDG